MKILLHLCLIIIIFCNGAFLCSNYMSRVWSEDELWYIYCKGRNTSEDRSLRMSVKRAHRKLPLQVQANGGVPVRYHCPRPQANPPTTRDPSPAPWCYLYTSPLYNMLTSTYLASSWSKFVILHPAIICIIISVYGKIW